MSDPFEELEQDLDQPKEKTFDDVFNDFVKYLEDSLNKLNVGPIEWEDPFTEVKVKWDGSHVIFCIKDKCDNEFVKSKFKEKPYAWKFFVRAMTIFILSSVSKRKVNKLNGQNNGEEK